MMPIGFLIVFVYVTLMLGRLNCVQQRSMLALAGLASIGMTVGFTYGICSAVGLFYGPMHNIIPFLLLGIGIDDMFVIMQCYDNLTPAERWECKKVNPDPLFSLQVVQRHSLHSGADHAKSWGRNHGDLSD